MVPSLEPDVYYGFMCPRTKKKKNPTPTAALTKGYEFPLGNTLGLVRQLLTLRHNSSHFTEQN
jgi:uncharacterized protein YhjY with autotransporter beta-barrel domain